MAKSGLPNGKNDARHNHRIPRQGPGAQKMNTKYDPDANALYVKFSDEKISRTEELRPGFIVDYDGLGHIVGIEMLDAKQVLSEAALKALAAA